MRILFSVSFLLSVSACTINAPQVEDVEGAALSVVDGRLEIDAKQVPVLTECEIGQLVSKTSAGWVCVGAGVTDVVVGAGLTGGGTGVSNVAVDFGNGASQVATGERATALEAGLTAAETTAADLTSRVSSAEGAATSLATRVSSAEGAATTLAVRVSTAEGKAVTLASDITELALEIADLVERLLEFEAPTVPPIIAQFRGEDIVDNTNLWPSDVGEAVIALSSQALVTSAGNSTASIQAGSASVSGGFGGGLGLTRIALPPSNFSVEMLVNSTGCIFTHGVDNTPMSLKVCIGPGGVTVNEGLVNILAVLPQGFPDMGLGTRVVHLVYVHGDTERRLYINGFPFSLSPHIAGPYQGGDAPLLLGEHNFAGNAGGVIIHDLVFHGLPLTQAEVRLSCRNSTPPLEFCLG